MPSKHTRSHVVIQGAACLSASDRAYYVANREVAILNIGAQSHIYDIGDAFVGSVDLITRSKEGNRHGTTFTFQQPFSIRV